MRTLILTLLSIILYQSGFSQQDSLRVKLERMYELTSSREEFISAFRMNMQDSEPMLRIYYGDRFVDRIYQEMEQNGYDSIMAKVIPFYMQYFNEEDIDLMIEFYQTETGQKAASYMAELTTYTYEIGREYGESMYKRVYDEMQAEWKAEFEAKSKLKCNKLKQGTFYYEIAPGDTVKVERKLDMQIERGSEYESHLMIEWMDQCRYKLIPMDDDSGLDFDGALEVNVTRIEEQGYYLVYKLPGENTYAESYIWW